MAPAGDEPPGADGPATGRVRANGLMIAYEQHGARGRPAVLLIQGAGGQLSDWPPALCQELVRRGIQVII
jgi:hypothetical protein